MIFKLLYMYLAVRFVSVGWASPTNQLAIDIA
jgi:hypothetical protein